MVLFGVSLIDAQRAVDDAAARYRLEPEQVRQSPHLAFGDTNVTMLQERRAHSESPILR
jgi:hypothetical protein